MMKQISIILLIVSLIPLPRQHILMQWCCLGNRSLLVRGLSLLHPIKSPLVEVPCIYFMYVRTFGKMVEKFHPSSDSILLPRNLPQSCMVTKLSRKMSK